VSEPKSPEGVPEASGGHGMTPPPTAPPGPAGGEELRSIVREVLASLLPPAGAGDGAPDVPAVPAQSVPAQFLPAPTAPAQPGLAHTVRENTEAVEVVSLRTDADLAAFVRHLLHLFENPKHRDELRSGRLRFRLAAPAGPGSVQPSHRIEKGAVTEAMVVSAARAGARLVLGRGAVLTPLARDRARAAGVEIEKER
jgi:hypothetical protein